MPTALVKKYAKETGKTVPQVERMWDRAKAIAASKYPPKTPAYYAYCVGVLKNMLSLSFTSESLAPRDGATRRAAKQTVRRKKKRVNNKKIGDKARKDKEGKIWWDKLTRKQQKAYLKAHPNSSSRLLLKPAKREKVEVPAEAEAEPQQETQHELETPLDVGPVEEHGENESAPAGDDHEHEPQSLESLTTRSRGVIHRLVGRGLSKLSNIIKTQKQTFTGGLHAIKKYGNGEDLSEEDTKHLKNMATIVMGVALASAVAFTPIMPYSASLTHMYLDHLRNRNEEDGEGEIQRQPTVMEEPEIEGVSSEEAQHLQQLSSDMTDWIMDQDQDRLARELRELSR